MAFPSVGIAGQTDTCLLRQIGGNDTHTLSFDMFDNPNSADGQGFAIRTIPTAASAGTQFALSSIQTDFFVDATSGNIGIGTATPNRALTVVGDVSATGATSVQSLSSRFINLEHSVPNDGTNPVLFIGERGDGTGGTVSGSLSGFNTTYDEINNRLVISTRFGVSPSLTAVTVTSAGNVGIGTLSPNRALTVVGDVSATGSIFGTASILGGVPTGAVIAFAMNGSPAGTPPDGWLAANGSEYLKTGPYSNLFNAIGITYGETNGAGGVGTTHFRVPDLRGYFVRGVGTNSDGTAAGAFGAKQADALKSHIHPYKDSTSNSTANYVRNASGATFDIVVRSVADTDRDTTATGDTETRPRNIAMLYCIKF
jgi:microcystin-dependent protein